MKMTLNKQELTKALTLAGKLVPKQKRNQGATPIVGHVRIACDMGVVKVYSTDQVTSLCTTMGGSGEFDVVTPLKELRAAVKMCKGSVIEIGPGYVQGSRLGGARFPISAQARDEYPPFPEKGSKIKTATSLRFINAYRDLLTFASTEVARYILHGVHFDGSVAVATDGRRLCRIYVDDPLGTCSCIVPNIKALGDKAFDDIVEVGTSDGEIKVVAGNHTLISKMIEGTYPNYKQVMPTYDENNHWIDLAGEAEETLLDMGKVIKDGTVRIEIRHGNAEFVVHDDDDLAERARFTTDKAHNLPDKPMKVSLGYLCDALNKGYTRHCMPDELSPWRSDTESGVHVLMPMRVS